MLSLKAICCTLLTAGFNLQYVVIHKQVNRYLHQYKSSLKQIFPISSDRRAYVKSVPPQRFNLMGKRRCCFVHMGGWSRNFTSLNQASEVSWRDLFSISITYNFQGDQFSQVSCAHWFAVIILANLLPTKFSWFTKFSFEVICSVILLRLFKPFCVQVNSRISSMSFFVIPIADELNTQQWYEVEGCAEKDVLS